LAFKPDDDTFTAKDSQRHFHHIKVSVTKPGLHVRSRTGFLGETDADMRKSRHDPVNRVRKAMLSPFLSNGIRLDVTPLYAEVKGRGPVVRNLLHIDARDLDFVPDGLGQYIAKVDVLAVALGGRDAPLAQVANSYSVSVAGDRLERLKREGLVYTLDVPVNRSGPYQVRAAVRDETSQAIGSAHQYIEVPDAKKGKLALTSLILSGREAGLDQESTLIAAARRRYHAGAKLTYLSVLEGADGKSKPDIQARLRLFRENQEVYAAPITLATVKSSGWALAGTVQLPSNFATGRYYLQISVRDNAHRHRLASQWMDFEVLSNESSLDAIEYRH
jgi:hypothetical protein